MSKKFTLTPQNLQYILGFACIALLAVAVYGFYFLQDKTTQQAKDTDRAKIEAESIESDLLALKSLRAYFNDPINDAQVKKTQAVVGESFQYNFQNQVVEDLTRYATMSNISIKEFVFETKKDAKVTAAPTEKVIPGLPKKTLVSVRVGSGTSYESFIKFLKYIERNTTKMQLSNVGLQPDDKVKDAIKETSVGLEVYLR